MTSAAARVALILGAGSNIGDAVAQTFIANNYKVVTVSRSGKTSQPESANRANISADLSDVDSISKVFRETESKFGIPEVVVYNGTVVQVDRSEEILTLSQ